MHLFKSKQSKKERTTGDELNWKAKEYLRAHYTKDNVTSMETHPKFYMLESDSINGISQGICTQKNWLNMNNQPIYKDDSNQILNGCKVDINYTNRDEKDIKDWKPIYFDKELPNGKKEKNDMPVWHRKGGEQLSKIFGNSSISSESARTVKLGGKKKKNRKTKKRT